MGNNIYGGAGDDTLRGSVFTYIRGDVGYDECWDDGKPYLHKGCEGPLTPTQQPVAGKDKKEGQEEEHQEEEGQDIGTPARFLGARRLVLGWRREGAPGREDGDGEDDGVVVAARV